MRTVVTIWAAGDTPRLRYVLDWLFGEQLGINYRLTQDAEECKRATHSIAYGFLPDVLSVPTSGLLEGHGFERALPTGGHWNDLYTLFQDPDGSCTLPFDLFSAIFYLLSRQEEYQPFTGDRHGRFPSAQSVLSRDGVLERPVVDEWVRYFRELLIDRWQLALLERHFRFQPTYDIDIAWSFRHKGWKRWIGASLKEILTGKWEAVGRRMSVLTGQHPDPYDAYSWLEDFHKQHHLHPHFFILAALQDGPFDKNIAPSHPAMQSLVRSLQQQGTVGMHPSYEVRTLPSRLLAEKKALEQIMETGITTSRQHFIRLFLPDTYRRLLEAGITDDYSMGYATALGFRAGTSHSFYWYDLEREAVTALRVHPFCFMDTTAHFDLGLDTATAFGRLRQMAQHLKNVNGVLTPVFHNFSLGTDPQWDGWRAAYAQLMQEM